MKSIDWRLMKWWGELMVALASNAELREQMIGAEWNASRWYEMWELLPGFPKPPFPKQEGEELQREWLALFDAVSKRDYDNLQARLEVVEEKCKRLRAALTGITTAMASVEQVPQAIATWLEFAQKTITTHMEWLRGLGKSWTRETGTNGKDLSSGNSTQGAKSSASEIGKP